MLARPRGFSTENGCVMCVDKPPVTLHMFRGKMIGLLREVPLERNGEIRVIEMK